MTDLRGRWPKGRLLAKLVAAVTLILPVMAVNAEMLQAHNLNACGDGQTIKWAESGTTHYYPLSWESGLVTAIGNASTNFNTSDFSYAYVSITSALVTWVDLNQEWQIAGAYYIYVNCSSHTIGSGTIKMNLPHFNHDIHTTGQKKCTAIHEMAHVAGFDHNSLTSVLLTSHSQRCHSQLINTLQTHDLNDINARY